MSLKYCPTRRLFLSRAADSLGLLVASNLFNNVAFSQTNTLKKNVIFIFFNHGANIPFGNRENDFRQGGFSFGSQSNLGKLKGHAGDSLFIRGSNNFFKNPNDHNANQTAAFTGHTNRGPRPLQQFNYLESVDTKNDPHAGKSVDVVAGEFLQKKYGTHRAYMPLAYGLRHSDAQTSKSSFTWKTSTWTSKDSYEFPNMSVRSTYDVMKKSINCDKVIDDKPRDISSEKLILSNDIKKLNLIQDNIKNYKSKYLLPGDQTEKLYDQINKKISTKQTELDNLNNSNNNNNNTELANACRNFKLPTQGYKDNDDFSFNNFNNKSQAFFDLMIHSFKTNYCRSATYYTNSFERQQHNNCGHGSINNQYIKKYLDQLAQVFNTLVNKLKQAGIYDETLIVITGEFAQQSNSEKDRQKHRRDNLPWLVINSGKSGEFNEKKVVHPGDIHCNILNRMGMNVKRFGAANHDQLKRPGTADRKIFT